MITQSVKLFLVFLSFTFYSLHAQTDNSCEKGKQWKSNQTGSSINTQFINNIPENVKLYWIDSKGKSNLYQELYPGTSYTQGTYAQHVWKVENSEGECLGIYQLTEQNEPIKIEGKWNLPTKTTKVQPVSAELVKFYKLDPFYKKYINGTGVPVLSSGNVNDEALVKANEILIFMLQRVPQVLPKLQLNKIRVAIIGAKEQTLDIPEHSDMQTAFPEENWNTRARGFGATISRPATSTGEENLLCYNDDRYLGENILVHEFAHTIMFALENSNPDIYKEILNSYKAARKQGLWDNTYAATNPEEYWAEGVQSWFDTNLESSPSNGVHGEINTRKELKKYDSRLAAVIQKVFGTDSRNFNCK